MQVTLTNEEVKEVLLNSLCNGGLTTMGYSGFDLDYSAVDYKQAKERLQAKNPATEICYEDILLEILNVGKNLTFIDTEGDNDGILNLETATKNLSIQDAAEDVMTSLAGEDDATTADNILQYAMFGEIIYG